MIAQVELPSWGALATMRDEASLAHIPGDWPNRDASRIVLSGDRAWHVQEFGQGPSVLLLHGTGASTHSWGSLAPALAERVHVLAPDLLGHGYTEARSGEALSIERMSAALGRLLGDLGFRPECVIGHSAGAAIALQMELDGYIRPRSSIGLNAALTPFGGPFQPLLASLSGAFAASPWLLDRIVARASDRRSIARLLESTGSDIDAAGESHYQRLLMRREHVRGVLSMMSAWRLDDLLGQLAELESELVNIAARGDKAVRPQDAERVRRWRTDVRIVPVDGGHLVHEERPVEIAALLLDIIRRGDGASDLGGGLS